MPRPLLILLCCAMSLIGQAQWWGPWGTYYYHNSNGSYTAITTGRGGVVSPEEATWLETDLEEPPAFPGGAEALAKYFSNVTECTSEPVDAACKKDRKVLVWFIVERDGSVQEAWIDRGGCEALQQSTICSVLHMPTWTPGRRRGEVVRTRVRLPLVYQPKAEGQ